MKPIIQPFSTGKTEGLFILLKGKACDDYEIIRDQDNFHQMQLQYPSDQYRGLQNYDWINLPEGEWKDLGFAKDLTEEQLEMIVDDFPSYRWQFRQSISRYKNYLDLPPFESTKESFKSLMESLNCFEENPYGEEIPVIHEDFEALEKSIKQWQEAQERTGSWLVLIKNK